MSNLKYRLATIALLVVASLWALFPRDVTQRQRTADGTFRDTTFRRVPLKYGLDLRGGMHLELEVDDSRQAIPGDQVSDAMQRALKTVRNRIAGIGVSEAVVQQSGNDRIVVELPGLDDPERARQIIQDQAYLEFQITDKTNALDRVSARLDQVVREQGLVTGPAATTPSQASSAPIPGALFQGADSADSARTDSAAATPLDSLNTSRSGPFSSLLQPGQMPGEYFVERVNVPTLERYLSSPAVRAVLPPAKELLFGSDTTVLGGKTYLAVYMVDQRPIITGESLTDARPNQSPTDGTIVQFELDNVGARRFRNETGKHVGDYMAIVLDGRVMGRPPVIQSAIGRNGQITLGGRGIQAAQDLALVLRAGALPVPLRVAEMRTIGATLGQDAIRQGINAGVLGLVMVVLIMVTYYRFSGMLAVGGLVFYALTTLAFLATVDAALTLPGIAGFILSIGMAVDANFLQFERIREELARGRTVRSAIEEGFQNSFSAIVDTHVTTALTGAVLYQYGTGPVQGFAVTLVAGVVSSMVSSVFVVRTFFLWWLNRSRGAQTLSI